MKKMRLDVEQLRVDTFATERPLAGAGTVHAHATPPTYCGNTCAATCQTNCDCTFGCNTYYPIYCTMDR